MNCPKNYECGCENCGLTNNAECEIGVEYLEENRNFKAMKQYIQNVIDGKEKGCNPHRPPHKESESHGSFYDDLLAENKIY